MADSSLGAIRQRSRTIRKGKATNRRTGRTASFGQDFPSLISSDQRLCFPRPRPDSTNTRSGSVVLRGVPPRDAPDSDGFLCDLDGQGWGRELVPEIIGKRVKVPPGAVYSTKLVEAQAAIETPGLWRPEAYYRPPEAHFGDRAAYRRYLQTAAEGAGCVIPDAAVSGPSRN
jgi:hypothetical protein